MTTSATQPRTAVRPIEAIRGDFPALTRMEQGHPVAYFDGPGANHVSFASQHPGPLARGVSVGLGLSLL